eukprot:jgi/Mesvir1/1502/Mv14485-RA.1
MRVSQPGHELTLDDMVGNPVFQERVLRTMDPASKARFATTNARNNFILAQMDWSPYDQLAFTRAQREHEAARANCNSNVSYGGNGRRFWTPEEERLYAAMMAEAPFYTPARTRARNRYLDAGAIMQRKRYDEDGNWIRPPTAANRPANHPAQ